MTSTRSALGAPSKATDPVVYKTLAIGKGTKISAIAAGLLAAEDDDTALRLLVADTATSPWTVSAVHPQ